MSSELMNATETRLPAPGNTAGLTRDETDSLFVLVRLYMQLGDMETARLILKNLEQVCPQEHQVLKYLAAVELELGNPKKTLGHLAALFRGWEMSTREAALLLLKAKALWLENREEESRHAVEQYLSLTGE